MHKSVWIFLGLMGGVLFGLSQNAAGPGEGTPSKTPLQEAILSATKASRAPMFNGPRLVGVRLGTPLAQALSVSGERPMTFVAIRIPEGLTIDPKSGTIVGKLVKRGEYTVSVRAANPQGEAQADLKIVAGETIALTPPMGWNSYDAYGDGVNEAEFLANAEWLKDNLQPYGYDTVVIDFRWWDPDAQSGRPVRQMEGTVNDVTDGFGRLQPAISRFPSAGGGRGFKPLAEKIHGMGLKFGIHIMRGIPRHAVKADKPIVGSTFSAVDAAMPEGDPNRLCPWCVDMYGVRGDTPAGEAWYRSIVQQYAEWGVDFIKADDMSSLFSFKPDVSGSSPYAGTEIAALQKAILASGRSIVLSLSPGATPLNQAGHVARNANLWRISADFWDEWDPLNKDLSLLVDWSRSGASGQGHWPDGDMLPIGILSLGGSPVGAERQTRFTVDEQLTLLTAWCMAPSPLMIGACLPRCDDWTKALLTNPEVLAVNQDSLGAPMRRLAEESRPFDAWIRPLAGGGFALALINRSGVPVKAEFPLGELGLGSTPAVRDLWPRLDLGRLGKISRELPPHGCAMFRIG